MPKQFYKIDSEMDLCYGTTFWRLNEHHAMKQCTFKIVNDCSNTNIHPYLETSGGQSSNLYLNVIHFFNTSVI
jgi:hypothetical protein